METNLKEKVCSQIFDEIQDGIKILSTDLKIIACNPKMKELFPSEESPIGKKYYEVGYREKEECNNCKLKEVLVTGKAVHSILKGPYDTKYREFEVSVIPIKDSGSDKVLAVAEIVKDISKHKDTETLEETLKLLEREKQVFETVFHTLPYPMYMKDTKSRFLMLNNAYAEKFNFDNIYVLNGKSDFDLFTEEHARPAFEDEQEIMATGIPKIGYEEKETSREGNITYCLSTKIPLYDHLGNSNGLLGISVDITDLKNTEEKISEKLKEIELINKKLENYSFTISHDLKEPIRSIRTFSEFIIEDYGDKFDDEASDYFNRIIRASSRMALMIDDLLILSRIGRVDTEFKKVSITEIIKGVQDTLQQLIRESNTQIILSELPEINCQPVWVHAIFQNLITNSIKHNDKNETIIEITYKDTPKYHEFSVKDNGRGIAKDQHKKVFGLFRKAHQDRNTEGSGAGLAIVADVIEHHYGKIWIEWSEVGVGTEIKFTIKKR